MFVGGETIGFVPCKHMISFFKHYSGNTPCPRNKCVKLCSKTIKDCGIFSQSSVEIFTVSQGRKTPPDVVWGFPKAGSLKSVPYGTVAQF